MKEERKVIELNLDDILPNRFQPRIRFDENAINELAESIKEHGVIQPIVVRPIVDKYEIIAGERRYKASVLAGKKTIPAIVTDFNDKESAEIALIENVQRQNLTPIEEAVSYKKILDMGYLTQNQLADKLGKDQSTVANKLRLLNLDEDVQEALLNEKISERHARSLLRLGHKDQRELLHRIIEKRLTVRKTDEEINKILKGTSVKEEPIQTKEVLESGDSISPVKEEISMDQNMFNIPDTTIIEEPQPVNPGFMDIHKIEDNATDIFEEKPVANMDNLLEPSTTPLVEEKPQVEEEEEVQIRPGKFFNLFPEEEVLISNEEFTEPEMVLEPTPVEIPQYEEPETLDLDDIMIPDYQEIIPAPVEVPTVSEQPITEPDYSFEFDFGNDTNTINEQVSPAPVQMVGNDLMSAINAIRECADAIEKSGFEIDVDEFDFEDMYQVIFKVNKKK